MADKIASTSKLCDHIQTKKRIKNRNKKRVAKTRRYFKRAKLLKYLVKRRNIFKMTEDSKLVSSDSKRWDPKDEIAFWKARTVSLEYENKMLHKHIKNMYLSMIKQNNQADENQSEQNAECKKKKKEKNKKYIDADKDEDEEESKPPTERYSHDRLEQIKQLYGSEYQTILGMETSIQLKFDLLLEKHKYDYWPVVPLRM